MISINAALLFGWQIGLWAVCVAIAGAWLSRGISLPRVAALAVALFWPVVPAWHAFSTANELSDSRIRFRELCQTGSYQRILRRAGPVSEIFVDSRLARKSEVFLPTGIDANSLLSLGSGFQQVHLIHSGHGGSPASYSKQTLDWALSPSRQAPLDENLARYGIRFEEGDTSLGRGLLEYRSIIFDRLSNEILAEQKNYRFVAPTITLPGRYPLFLQQEMTCPLPGTELFLKYVLGAIDGASKRWS